MKLYELAIATYIYNWMGGGPDSYLKYLKESNRSPDLNKDEHRLSLLKFLNQWGCRQFATNSHDSASQELLNWYNNYKDKLSNFKQYYLWKLSDDQINLLSIEEPYQSLSKKCASIRKNQQKVTFGPTGASKILFALMPHLFIAWDGGIRKAYKCDGSASSYVKFLIKTREEIKELEKDCKKAGFELHDLPGKLNKGDRTILKLVDEYNWTIKTEEFPLPESSQLECILKWQQL